MTWFQKLTGLEEETREQVHAHLVLEGERITSLKNQKSFACGVLEIPALSELRQQVRSMDKSSGKLSLKEVVADVQSLHLDPNNAGALFQAASQFNLLEMTSPGISPEQGVGIYEYDHTQGPACAIAAGAGTIYRNYFVPLNGQVGQTKHNQIDCLADLGSAFKNTSNRLWHMQNGYALASTGGLREIANRLQGSSDLELEAYRGLLRVGWQQQAQVTLQEATHRVSQVYCSALPVAYSSHPPALWEAFARLVLEASYEAAVCSAILNAARTGNRSLFLTLLGGRAFGNDERWIMDAIRRALQRYLDWDVQVAIVSYGSPKDCVRQLVREFHL